MVLEVGPIEELEDDMEPTYERAFDRINYDHRPISLEEYRLLKSDLRSMYKAVSNFETEVLARKYPQEFYYNTVYHHILGLSSDSLDAWNSMPIDTPDHDYAQFVSDYKKKTAA